MDFTNLNKACPKDPFLIPRIDQLVNTIVSHPQMSFLDAFQGYHQIPLGEDYFCYAHSELSLQIDAIWTEECKIHLSEDGD